jgi:rRNA maturation RNase YbeY
MATGKIQFHYAEGCRFKLPASRKHAHWLSEITRNEGLVLQSLAIVFCSDEYLLEINREYLQHDYYTDIITFDLSEHPNEIEGELYISIDRTIENAAELKTSTLQETRRVMAHGLLHLCGYGDKSDQEALVMRQKEDHCLGLANELFHVEHTKI